MSLLIKALQKAEKSRDAKDAEQPTAEVNPVFELAPQEPKVVNAPQITESAPGNEAQVSLADEAGFSEYTNTNAALTFELESLKAEAQEEQYAPPELTTAPPHSTKVPSVKEKPASNTASDPLLAQQQAATRMLNMRTGKTKPVVSTTSNRRGLWLAGIALLLLLCGGGGLFYYLQAIEQPSLLVVQPAASTPVPQPLPSTSTVTAVAADPIPAVAPDTVTDKPEQPIQPLPILENKANNEIATTSTTAVTSASKNDRETTESFRVAKTKQPSPNKETNPLKVTRLRSGEPAVSPILAGAYQAFLNGDDVAADKLYKQFLQTDPRNIDALLGSAALAAKQDRLKDAVEFYQKALVIDPKNSVAQAGLIILSGQADPSASISQLKSMIAQQPEAAYLHSALGGLYADQHRWADAQLSYFQAFSLDSNNPDYVFNLAVSLDQINKPDLALEYYQRAAGLLSSQEGSIDQSALESRISQLKTALGK